MQVFRCVLLSSLPRHIHGPVTNSRSEKVKFVDDGTIAVSIDLKACLVSDPVDRPRPHNYHERTEHILPEENNLLQFYIKDTEQFVLQNRMIINKQKTKVISFTKSRKWDFPPELKFSDGTPIEYLSELKLLGVVVSEDTKWAKNTDYICQKARTKIWILRRLLNLDLSIHQMFDVYAKEVRSILELAVPVWHSGLTRQQAAEIEGIQKIAMKIILQNRYVDYQSACAIFSTTSLEERRLKVCSKFTAKNVKSENPLFTIIGTHVKTRNKNVRVKEYKCNFGRYKKSSIPYLAKLFNTNNQCKA